MARDRPRSRDRLLILRPGFVTAVAEASGCTLYDDGSNRPLFTADMVGTLLLGGIANAARWVPLPVRPWKRSSRRHEERPCTDCLLSRPIA